ncbi:NADH-quinone oxidoreductase subunit C [Acidocella aromatica]|uniref:NADH-quinone oxidoreductase subunit C n=1 Tax=Acidocella aromatica TaxID=1303579 RepID=A0A840VAB5_9PROT|nr:NADH-quinone oxidoreductase subunit C [Acidocella aromatica]
MADATKQDAPEAVPPVDIVLQTIASLPGVLSAHRERDELVAIASSHPAASLFKLLRDAHGFEQVMDICGVDYPERPKRFDVVYNLLSVTRNLRLRVVMQVAEGEEINSVSDVWPSAGWWERETWDLFGVRFNGLADHRRILTDYGFEGHPLRKDFPLTGYVEVHYDTERKTVVYDKVKLTQEFRNFDFLSPWEGMTTLPGDEKARGDRR